MGYSLAPAHEIRYISSGIMNEPDSKPGASIRIAGIDRTREWRDRYRTNVEDRRVRGRDRILPPVLNARSLREQENESAYLRELVRLIHFKRHVGTHAYRIPHRPGMVGKVMLAAREVLWKILRYQHDRMASRQNVINSHVIDLLSYEHEERVREIEQLRAELKAIREGKGPAS